MTVQRTGPGAHPPTGGTRFPPRGGANFATAAEDAPGPPLVASEPTQPIGMEAHDMNQPTLPRLGAACGAVFAIVLTVAAGNGNQSFSGPRAVAGIAAITLALPF